MSGSPVPGTGPAERHTGGGHRPDAGHAGGTGRGRQETGGDDGNDRGDKGGKGGKTQPGRLRTALGGLTTRGRSFLAAGMAAAVCAYVLGQSDLLRVGMLLAALPLVCVLVLYRTHYRVSGSRRLAPARVAVRNEARVHLGVENVSRLPTGLLMLEDRVPYVLGPRPRFVLDRVEPGGSREVSYRVRSDMRGSYQLGPLQLRLTDPFGMCELTRSFSTYDTLTVVPQTVQLPPARLTGDATGYGDGRHRSLALAGEDDVIPRGYRHGDDLRRVHWRSTARYGELMVRREEQPQKARCTVLLDTRRTAYTGSGPDSPFEWAVTGAASVCMHLLERGYAVRLLTDTGTMVPGPEGVGFAGNPSDSAGVLLDALAQLEHSEQEGMSHAYDMLRGAVGGQEGLLVAFLGGLEEEDASTVGRMRQRTNKAVAFCSTAGPDSGEAAPYSPSHHGEAAGDDAAAYGLGHPGMPEGAPATATVPPPAAAEDDGALQVLRESGWTALRGGPGLAMQELWREADQATVRGTDP